MKSIKEKAEAYDKVLEWATEAHKVCDGMLKEDLEHLFPELKESEDEIIRKELIDFVKSRLAGFSDCKRFIDWLEKQGEQKPAAWSEEDEKMCQETIDWFERKCFPYALESENPARESIKWLKSLKDRYTWRPSDEQMEALEHFIIYHNGSTNYAKDLEELRLQLKKLREE